MFLYVFSLRTLRAPWVWARGPRFGAMRLLLSLVSLAAAGAHVSDERLLRLLLSRAGAAARLRSLQPRPPPGGGGGGPGGGMTPGAAASTACGSAACTPDGGGTYMSRSLALNTTTGLFSGSLTTNACPNHAGAYEYSGVKDLRVAAATASCQKWTLPVAGYTVPPVAAPLRASIGYTISGGEAIYGPMDAGFTLGQVCTTAYGTCPAGTDTRFCGALIERACGTANLKGNTTATMHMLLSDCGGHAGYHNHEGLGCENSSAQAAAAVAGHSPLLAVMLDGRGLYGQHEAGGAPPADLDACNGHAGPTPATAVGADTYPATDSTYHYHITTSAPFTVGCFGPVASAAQARGLYSSCAPGGAACACSQGATCSCSAGQVMTSVCTSLGSVASYTLDCPIYGASGGLTAPPYIDAGDPRCVPCAGDCPAQGATSLAPGSASRTRSAAPTPSSTPTPTQTPSPSPTPTPPETPSASPPPQAPAASSPPQSPSPSPTSPPSPPASSPAPPPPTPTPAAATPAAPPATASASLVLQGPLPASAFLNGTLAPAALASLTQSLALAAAAAGCSCCAARITRAVETATGAVVFDGGGGGGGAAAAARRRALAGIGALTLTYTVTGPAAGVAAATTAPSPAFAAVLSNAVFETYGVGAGVAAAAAAGAGAAAPAAAAAPAGALSEAAKGAIGGAVGGCALLGLLAAAVYWCRQGGKARRAGSTPVTSSQA